MTFKDDICISIRDQRFILAFAILISTMILSFNEVDKEILFAFISILSAAITYYFVKKERDESEKK